MDSDYSSLAVDWTHEAIVFLIVLTIRLGADFVSPQWLNLLGIRSLLSMFVTGVYLFGLHSISKLRRAMRI